MTEEGTRGLFSSLQLRQAMVESNRLLVGRPNNPNAVDYLRDEILATGKVVLAHDASEVYMEPYFTFGPQQLNKALAAVRSGLAVVEVDPTMTVRERKSVPGANMILGVVGRYLVANILTEINASPGIPPQADAELHEGADEFWKRFDKLAESHQRRMRKALDKKHRASAR